MILYTGVRNAPKSTRFLQFLRQQTFVEWHFEIENTVFSIAETESLTWFHRPTWCFHFETCMNPFHVFLFLFTPPWQVNISASCSIITITFYLWINTLPGRGYPQENKILMVFESCLIYFEEFGFPNASFIPAVQSVIIFANTNWTSFFRGCYRFIGDISYQHMLINDC